MAVLDDNGVPVDFETPKRALLEVLSREFASRVTSDRQTSLTRKISLLLEVLGQTDFAILNLASIREATLFLFKYVTEAAYLLAS